MIIRIFSILFFLAIVLFNNTFFVFSTPMVFAAENGDGKTTNQIAADKQDAKDKKIEEQFFDFVQEQGSLLFDGIDAYGSFVVIAIFIILFIFFVASLTML